MINYLIQNKMYNLYGDDFQRAESLHDAHLVAKDHQVMTGKSIKHYDLPTSASVLNKLPQICRVSCVPVA